MHAREPRFDEIGYWSEIKLEIVEKYARAYSIILAKKKFSYVYIDGFAGPGVHISKSTGEFIPGSPLNALNISPSFHEYHLIDLDGDKTEYLKELARGRRNVYVYHGDCNEILLEKIFPQLKWEDYRRGLCLLDPYGLHLSWEVIETAGKMRTIDLFLNFPIMDMNRTALWRDWWRVSEYGIQRMTRFWGDESWKDIAYTQEETLFGPERVKATNEDIVKAFRTRLRKKAGFNYVPEPIPMRNSQGAVIYYLFFASHKPVAAKIVTDIFSRYRDWGAQ